MSQPVENTTTDPVETPVVETPTSNLSHEDALKELAKVRAEAAAKRVKNKELEEAAKKWEEYQESQKTELQKLQDDVAARDKKIAEKELEVTRSNIAKQFNVADEDLDLLVGDEDNMKRLAARLGTTKDSKSNPLDLLAGNRGNPVGGKDTTPTSFMDNLIRGNSKSL
jgi:septal ring factor EnvC (AmiA/AmiB activator)